MAKYFLGSVGTAEAFRMVNGKLEMAFVSKTLTDSGLNISTTKDDLRAGTGAGIVASFYHDPSVEITLTDVMFKTEYVEAQLGVAFNNLAKAYYSETITPTTDDSLTLTKTAEKVKHCSDDRVICWITENGKDEWKVYEVSGTPARTVAHSDFKTSKTYCVRYLTGLDYARDVEITANIIPQELYLVITAPIFAGDACSASNGSQAGYIQFEVPRFRLNGAQDFAMNMSSNQTMSLAGTALAMENGCEVNGSKLLRIIEVILDRKWYASVKKLIVDEDCLFANTTPEVYALNTNGSLFLIPNPKLSYTDSPVTSSSVWTDFDDTTHSKFPASTQDKTYVLAVRDWKDDLDHTEGKEIKQELQDTVLVKGVA